MAAQTPSPVFNNILVKIVETNDELVLPDTAYENITLGKVEGVPEEIIKDGVAQGVPFKVGDNVYFRKRDADQLKDSDYYLTDFTNILAVNA